MKVLLLKDVKSLGVAGEIKDVKDGYGQNFIINKGYGKLATQNVIKQYEAQQKRLAVKKEEEIKTLQEKAKIIEKKGIKILKKVGANGSLFGAITKDEIVQELAKEKIDIDKKTIELQANIKATGIYDVSLKLGHGVVAKLQLEVGSL